MSKSGRMGFIPKKKDKVLLIIGAIANPCIPGQVIIKVVTAQYQQASHQENEKGHVSIPIFFGKQNSTTLLEGYTRLISTITALVSGKGFISPVCFWLKPSCCPFIAPIVFCSLLWEYVVVFI